MKTKTLFFVVILMSMTMGVVASESVFRMGERTPVAATVITESEPDMYEIAFRALNSLQ